MFKKKACRRCGKNLKERYDFCPYCGNRLDSKKEDLGMLGKNDSFDNMFNSVKLPIGMNTIFNSLMKNLEKQFKDLEKKTNKEDNLKRGNISISISTSGENPPVVKVNSMPAEIENPEEKEAKKIRMPSPNFPPDKLRKFSNLPREEPKTNIRRFSNKVIYEIDLPGVKSSKDISILPLEKGIELKALSENKAYLKSIPITLPIIAYKLKNGKLSLELDARED